ncbi:hypothetical protein HX052_09195 [Myroides marinus]|uniref:hypothetical protein n=1 Tax=Myroides marinus TaxID=703342 RepID=UPI002577B09E|nr:hypothetical protein [Myroides marinus]MDM1368932.1 hypothetical protein [Myroides marinus]MDM1371878.1 hypothetical protein [Myroides marinus]MDM1375586.1 hypothetical protein [Myroides marinus]MDM1378926.1 hypothetical protein [Myroides marinus]MDM1382812.1 hypothetical protein [Myroides marinus]
MKDLYRDCLQSLKVLIKEHPEYWGLLIMSIGIILLFCSIKGYSFMYDQTGGPTFNTAWLRNTFGEKVAKTSNIILFSTLTLVGLYFYIHYKE